MILRKNNLIILILILAFLLRIIGIDYGLPNFFIGDEKALVGGALRMMELKTLIPSLHPQDFRLLYYPPLISYLYLLFFTPIVIIKYFLTSNLDLLKINFILNPGIFILIARFLSALFSAATIYLTYLLGKKIFNKRTAIFASLFLTFSFLHLQLSHMARHWIYDLFFSYLVILLSFYLPTQLLETNFSPKNFKDSKTLVSNKSWVGLPKRRIYFLIGIFAGLAFGTSYLPAISLLFPLIIHFAQPLLFVKKIKDKNLWLMLITFLIIAIAFISLHSSAFFRISVGEKSGIILEKNFLSYFLSFYYYFKILLKLETFLLLFSLIGFIFLFFKNKKAFYIFSIFIFFYITVLYSLFHHEPRYIFLILPLLCLAAGFALDYFFNLKITIYQKEFVLRNYFLIFIILIFIYNFSLAVKYDFLLLKKDSRVLAEEWAEKNIKADSKIANYLDFTKLIPTKEAILEQQKLDSQGLRSLEKILLRLNNEEYPSPSFHVLSFHFIDSKKLPNLKEYLKNNNYQYFLVDYWTKEELGERERGVINEANLVKRFGSDHPLEINGNFFGFLFEIFSLNRLGPIVEIYKL